MISDCTGNHLKINRNNNILRIFRGPILDLLGMGPSFREDKLPGTGNKNYFSLSKLIYHQKMLFSAHQE
jgi:hypothetical protein